MDKETKSLLKESFQEHEGNTSISTPENPEEQALWESYIRQDECKKRFDEMRELLSQARRADDDAALRLLASLEEQLDQYQRSSPPLSTTGIYFDLYCLRAALLARKEQFREAAASFAAAQSIRALSFVIRQRAEMLALLQDHQAREAANLEAEQREASEPRPNFAPGGKEEWLRLFFSPSEDLAGLFLSPEKILSSSYGEVKESELYEEDDTTLKRRGLLCPVIFGPTRDYACACEKYQGLTYEGVVCEVCGVELVETTQRRMRIGHITLATPVIHPGAYRRRANVAALLLGLKPSQLSSLLTNQCHMIIELSDKGYPRRHWRPGDIILTEQLEQFHQEYWATTQQGAVAIRSILSRSDLTQLQRELSAEQQTASSQLEQQRLQRRLALLEKLPEEVRLSDIVLEVLPVIAPEAPLWFPLDAGQRYELWMRYAHVIATNQTLARYLEENAPEEDTIYWRLALQKEVDALFAFFAEHAVVT
jgi:hypothetical protein